METLFITCNACENDFELEVSEDYGKLEYEFDACPDCNAQFDAFMRDRIERAFNDENTFSQTIGR